MRQWFMVSMGSTHVRRRQRRARGRFGYQCHPIGTSSAPASTAKFSLQRLAPPLVYAQPMLTSRWRPRHHPSIYMYRPATPRIGASIAESINACNRPVYFVGRLNTSRITTAPQARSRDDQGRRHGHGEGQVMDTATINTRTISETLSLWSDRGDASRPTRSVKRPHLHFGIPTCRNHARAS